MPSLLPGGQPVTEQKHVWTPMRDAGPQIHWCRIENAAGTGMSDVNACHGGVEAWLELKVYKGNRLVFQPTQPAWILKRRMHGGRVFILARKDDVLYLYDGAQVRQLMEQGINTPTLFRTAKPFDWGLLFYVVFGHSI